MLYLPSENGQGLTEYALLLSLVAIFVMLLLVVFSAQIIKTYERILTELGTI